MSAADLNIRPPICYSALVQTSPVMLFFPEACGDQKFDKGKAAEISIKKIITLMVLCATSSFNPARVIYIPIWVRRCM
jgi:hypothetical protein